MVRPATGEDRSDINDDPKVVADYLPLNWLRADAPLAMCAPGVHIDASYVPVQVAPDDIVTFWRNGFRPLPPPYVGSG